MSSSFDAWQAKYDGGLKLTPAMKMLLAKRKPIPSATGGQKLRGLYQAESANFTMTRLSPFGQACYMGHFDSVCTMVLSGNAPPLNQTETGFSFGYATITVAGAQRVEGLSAETKQALKHAEVLAFLSSHGLPVDIPDIVGYTALHHICQTSRDRELPQLVRLLITTCGANVDHQNVYGEVALIGAFQHASTQTIDVLLELGADLDIPEADDITPRKFALMCGPAVVAMVQKWIRKRSGETALKEDSGCGNCGKSGSLKMCVRCHIARYCSRECQKAHWSKHKKVCSPFNSSSTVTLKPSYEGPYGLSKTISTSEFARSALGIPPSAKSNASAARTGTASAIPSDLSEPKNITIKVQVPMSLGTSLPTPITGPLMVYTKKRDFACTVNRQDCPDGYDQISKVVQNKGIRGLKAYFAAELKSKDELVVKISEVLAEQPF